MTGIVIGLVFCVVLLTLIARKLQRRINRLEQRFGLDKDGE